jgi:hypothetical protein
MLSHRNLPKVLRSVRLLQANLFVSILCGLDPSDPNNFGTYAYHYMQTLLYSNSKQRQSDNVNRLIGADCDLCDVSLASRCVVQDDCGD